MPLTRLCGDTALEMVGLLPLSTITCLTLVQEAWKEFVDANETNIYYNAATFYGFVPTTATTLEDAIALMDFPAAALDIRGWKKYCQVQLAIERNWTGVGPSSMTKIERTLDYPLKSAGLDPRLWAYHLSSLGGISVSDGYETLWAFPPDYLQGPTFFAYDQGFLVFLNAVLNLSAMEVWHDTSSRTFLSKPSGFQRAAAESSALLHGAPAVGHFVPCFTLPPLKDESTFLVNSVRLIYPTLLAATTTHVHMWDISTGECIRALSIQGELDDHIMRLAGIEVSQDLVLAYDSSQLCAFPRHDGNFLYHLSKKNRISSNRTACRPAFTSPRRVRSRLSPCGTTLVVVADNNRTLVIHELLRLLKEDLPLADVAVEIKIAKEYCDPRSMCPAVTRNRIAIGTFRGILLLTLDRSKAGPAPPGSVRLGMSSVVPPIQVAASSINLRWQTGDGNLQIADTKLFFNASPRMLVDMVFRRESGRRTAQFRTYEDSTTDLDPPQQLQGPEYDDLPEDEESDDGAADDDVDLPVGSTGICGEPSRETFDSDSDSDDPFDFDSDTDSDDAGPAPGPAPPVLTMNPGHIPAMGGNPPPGFTAVTVIPQMMQHIGGALLANLPQLPQAPPLSSAFVIDTAPSRKHIEMLPWLKFGSLASDPLALGCLTYRNIT
ncbi:hypothetical protein B0H13DRAFT_2476488 [Mycena leptocephala]|nr:hypothetical protein B0H13DRAFT_2476488 [Mycena leptocephala]